VDSKINPLRRSTRWKNVFKLR